MRRGERYVGRVSGLRWGVATVLCGVSVALLACNGDHGNGFTGPPAGMASCAGNAVLTRSPVAVGALQNITPLGNLNPPGHVFPTDHLYLYPANAFTSTVPTDVVSPGNVTIVQVGRQTATTGGTTTTDYIVRFYPCADVMFYFYHLLTVSPDIAAQTGTYNDCNASYVIGSTTYQQCYKAVQIVLAAGAPVGTMGAGRGAFDFGGADRRVPTLAYVSPSRTADAGGEFGQNRAICPLDYFTADVAASMRALLGGLRMTRTAPPVCGEIMQDRAGTAQGRWFFDANYLEATHLALVHDNLNPALGAISVGTSIPTLPTGVYQFAPTAVGRVNADFARVTADGALYCYEVSVPSRQRIFVRMPDATTLQIGASPGSSCGDPATWNAALAATTFKR
jgi:hypothetical protein